MKLKLIGCQVFMRELYMLSAHSPHSVHIRWMPTDLHTQPQTDLRPALQAEIEKIESEADGCDAIVLGYGLCSMGTVGLKTSKYPLIVPRAHDCITMLLGSREKYQKIFEKYSGGVYWYSPGWIEQFKTPGRGYDEQAKYIEYVEKYGEENAEYLIEVEKSWMQHYSCAALIQWPSLKEDRFEAITKEIAEKQSLEYLLAEGEETMLKKLVYGEWDENFLRVEPGQTIVYSADERLLIAE